MLNREVEVAAFKERWAKANNQGKAGHRSEEALAPLFDQIDSLTPEKLHIPVVRSGSGRADFPYQVIGKASLALENRRIIIEYPEDGELARFFKLGDLREFHLSALSTGITNAQADEYRRSQLAEE